MKYIQSTILIGLLISAQGLTAEPGGAKHMHGHHMKMMKNHEHASKTPTQPGQDAFGTIQEIVQILEADPKTDWSKVNLENLRQHRLI